MAVKNYIFEHRKSIQYGNKRNKVKSLYCSFEQKALSVSFRKL